MPSLDIAYMLAPRGMPDVRLEKPSAMASGGAAAAAAAAMAFRSLAVRALGRGATATAAADTVGGGAYCPATSDRPAPTALTSPLVAAVPPARVPDAWSLSYQPCARREQGRQRNAFA